MPRTAGSTRCGAAARRVAEGYSEVQRGGTHQARLERDAAVASPAAGSPPSTSATTPSCSAASTSTTTGRAADDGRYYIGRISVTDDDQNPLVVDWRAPVAEPFYRATPIEPMGVVRRRHFHTKRPRAPRHRRRGLRRRRRRRRRLHRGGRGARCSPRSTGSAPAACATSSPPSRPSRTRRSAPICPACWSSPAGPAPARPRWRCTAPPTCSTRTGGGSRRRGVLLVGPNPIFLRYIDQVLPSLGEDDVQLTTPRGLKPQLRAGTEPTAVAAVKGDARMATVIARALADRERAAATATSSSGSTGTAAAPARRLRADRRAAPGGGGARTTSGARYVDPDGARPPARPVPPVARARLPRDVRRLDSPAPALFGDRRRRGPLLDVPVAAALARGERAPEEWEAEVAAPHPARCPRYARRSNACGRCSAGAELVHDLFSFPALDPLGRRRHPRPRRAGAAPPRPAPRASARSPGPRPTSPSSTRPTRCSGPVEAARPRRRRGAAARPRAEQLASRQPRGRRTRSRRATRPRPRSPSRYGGRANVAGRGRRRVTSRTFGHVLVDEAQDLTAMQWRMLGRRCPSGSMTLVGDFGQASRPGAVADWDAVLGRPARRPARPAASRSASTTARRPRSWRSPTACWPPPRPAVEPVRSVRSTGRAPRFVAAADATSSSARRRRRGAARHGEGGTVGGDRAADLHDDLVDAARATSARPPTRPTRSTRRSRCSTPLDAKGLEFDHVVVVEPARLVTPDAAGLRLLYMTLTRATRTLTVVHAAPLPEALEPTSRTGRGPMTTTETRPHRRRRRLGPRAARRRARATPGSTSCSTSADAAGGRDRPPSRRGARSSTPPGSRRSCASSVEVAGARRPGGVVRRPALRGRHHRPGAGCAAPARRGARHRDQHPAPLLRARMGRAARRPSARELARRRPAGVLPPPPRVGPPLPAAPPHRARRADPDREGGHRAQRVEPAVQRADVDDHRRARRRDA